jgi:hypothetical protein
LNVSATAFPSTYALVRPALAGGDAVYHHAFLSALSRKLGRSCISIAVSWHLLVEVYRFFARLP